jgi:hypothetical protein
MNEFKNSEEKVKQKLLRIANSNLKENSHLFRDYGPIPIKIASEHCIENVKKEDLYPAIILLRVVLAANRNYNRHVRKNLDRIKTNYPNLKSFKDLTRIVKSKSQSEFYEFWGHKNLRKYNVLINLLEAIELIRSRFNIEDDFELMNRWAHDVNINNLNEDEIGKIKDVALATVQHLRMDFGIDTVKPDQRVIEVLEREFVYKNVSQKKAIHLVEELSELSGISIRKIDMILVNYGSGYYDNRKYSSSFAIQSEIAKKLIRLGVAENIIIEATDLPIETLNEIKENK